MPADRHSEPWSALLDSGRADGRLVREAHEGPGGARLVQPPPELHPDVLAALERVGVQKLYSHQARSRVCGRGQRDDRHHRHRLRQVDVLQPADAAPALPAGPRTRAVPVSDQGARPGSGPGARLLRAEQAGAPGDLRRRYAARGACGDPSQRERGADEPRHAARRDPAQSRRLGRHVRQPCRGRGRRGARLSRRVRLARRQRPAPPAPHRGCVWHGAALPAHLRDDRQPGRAGRASDGPGRRRR